MRKYSPAASIIGYQIYTSSILNFSPAKDGERGWLSRVRTRYRKAVRECKDIGNDFYSNNSLNDDLDSRF